VAGHLAHCTDKNACRVLIKKSEKTMLITRDVKILLKYTLKIE
jgi:hypothetical protein